jgi:GLPGLI family protein
MKNILLTITCLFLLMSNSIIAQTRFVKSGTIEFNKSVNMFALINKQMSDKNANENIFAQKAAEAYKKNKPQFMILKSTLTFGDNKTLFVPDANAEAGMNNFNFPIAEQNKTVYTDLNTTARVSQKKVFEETFLVKDSVSKIKWKITDETREILGYTCRRANGLVLDSIYVVAFYTDQIAIVGGPESFTGLPGMILQVALPHENVSWIATKVTDTNIPAATLVPPKKGKVVTGKEFAKTLNSALKNWGNYAQDYLKALQL